MIDEDLQKFLGACGADWPLDFRVADAGGNEVGRWTLPRPFAVIGRDPKAEIHLDDERVSKRHAYVQVLAGRVLCVDLESRAGLTWDSVNEPSGWLAPGGVLGVGPYRVRLAESGRGGDGLASLPPPLAARTLWHDAPLHQVAIDGPPGPDGPRRHELGRVVTLVGRARDCRIRIRDASISRHHCVLLRSPGGVFVVDLLSREGTWVNGARVRWSRLVEGDVFDVGRFRARMVPGSPPSLPALRDPRSLARAVARPAAHAELVPGGAGDAAAEALLRPLVAQFGRMQEQMFDQFHQSLMTAFQLFGTLHRDQMAEVRRELDRIGEITEQLRAMQAKAAQPAAVVPAEAPPPGVPRVEEAATAPPPTRRPIRYRPRDAAADPDVHELICRRVCELQEERKGRWQALQSLIKGKEQGTEPAQG